MPEKLPKPEKEPENLYEILKEADAGEKIAMPKETLPSPEEQKPSVEHLEPTPFEGLVGEAVAPITETAPTTPQTTPEQPIEVKLAVPPTAKAEGAKTEPKAAVEAVPLPPLEVFNLIDGFRKALKTDAEVGDSLLLRDGRELKILKKLSGETGEGFIVEERLPPTKEHPEGVTAEIRYGIEELVDSYEEGSLAGFKKSEVRKEERPESESTFFEELTKEMGIGKSEKAAIKTEAGKPETKTTEKQEIYQGEVEVVEEPKKKEFDVAKALEDNQFIAFLERHRDFNVKEEELENLYTSFKATNGVVNFISSEIKKDTGLDFVDKNEARVAVENYFEAIHNEPREAAQMLKLIEEYKDFPNKIAAKQKSVEYLIGKTPLEIKKQIVKAKSEYSVSLALEEARERGKLVKAEERYEEMGLIKKLPLVGRFFRNKDEKLLSEKTFAEWKIKIDDLVERRKTAEVESLKLGMATRAAEKISGQIEETKENFQALRRGFFAGELIPALNIKNLIEKKLKSQLADMADPKKSIKAIESSLKLAEKLAAVGEKYVGKETLGEFNKKTEKAIEARVSNYILEIINKLNLKDPKHIKNMRTELEKTLKKGGAGIKEKEISREFVRRRLEDYLQSNAISNAKKMAIKILLFTWERK